MRQPAIVRVLQHLTDLPDQHETLIEVQRRCGVREVFVQGRASLSWSKTSAGPESVSTYSSGPTTPSCLMPRVSASSRLAVNCVSSRASDDDPVGRSNNRILRFRSGIAGCVASRSCPVGPSPSGSAFSVTSGSEFRCVSAPLAPCCQSTQSGAVAVARYRSMPGLREQSAPTDAPTPSGLIARRWSVEMRERRRPRERLVPERRILGQEIYRDGQVVVMAADRDRPSRSGATRYPRARRKSRRLARPGRGRRGPRRPCQ